MAAVASSSFAQDVKSILKTKDYAEAKSMLQACESTLSNEEKAKAYNKLVELSMQKFNKESAIMSENQVMQQMGQKGDKPVDKEGMYAALAKALNDAVECDKYDKLPNAKGKVAPKFHKKNQNIFLPVACTPHQRWSGLLAEAGQQGCARFLRRIRNEWYLFALCRLRQDKDT